MKTFYSKANDAGGHETWAGQICDTDVIIMRN